MSAIAFSMHCTRLPIEDGWVLQFSTPRGRKPALAHDESKSKVEATRDPLIAAMGTTPAAR
jgi:hypothetical protein